MSMVVTALVCSAFHLNQLFTAKRKSAQYYLHLKMTDDHTIKILSHIGYC